ncbi:MAG: membrane protein insertion efficiency factor YidD [Candidatus Komeilibacteria bacterium]|nr:membrane protein insertion efficiency factor YidD [Candidatus Komeilibacteria bacterium]
MKNLILKLIRLYQKILSPDSGASAYKHPYGYCRFYPHCSEYGYRAINKFGLFKGGWLTLKRVLKCNPLNKGGFDPLT